MTQNREHAHELIDCLPEAQVSGLISFLETIVDPVTAALRHAPLDDEPLSEEDRKAFAEAGNETVALETVLADLGLTMADWGFHEQNSATE